MPEIKEKGVKFAEADGYIKADITDIIKNTKNYGMMLKSEDENGYCAISTADSYDHPMIIRIQYE
jgi:hypothetical protein